MELQTYQMPNTVASSGISRTSTMSKRTGPLAPSVAFITGGARGHGNAIAVSFAKEGARGVVLVDIQDSATFAKGKKNVEDIGCEVCPLPHSHSSPTSHAPSASPSTPTSPTKPTSPAPSAHQPHTSAASTTQSTSPACSASAHTSPTSTLRSTNAPWT